MGCQRGAHAAGARYEESLLSSAVQPHDSSTIASSTIVLHRHSYAPLYTPDMLLQTSLGQAEGKDKTGFSITALHAPAQETTSALAAACSDGRLRLLSYSGRLEKVTDAAHDGSVVCVRWNRNGTAVATGGEDGALKTWSATGMIRATVAQGDKPIYSLAWSPDNTSVQFLLC